VGQSADPTRWLQAFTPAAAADLRRIIEASDGAHRADAVRIARDHGRSWRNITTALALSRHPPPP
jgi:hypothetical protein